ncbi:MAG: hypothetical protein H6772_00525 [Pseudomonadales bacterium]|nr:hypothetical protein [Pseudomonadales bacterium]
MHQFITKNFHKLQKLSFNSKLLLTFFFLVVIFTRFYNLDGTARFTRDESSDLARMHQYYQNKQLSLVGPISSEQDKVFSSLSYYMVMPFAIAFNFTPVSTVYGMAFYGFITAIFLLLIIHKVNPKFLFLGSVLIMIWYPLVLVSRWAWNPHFVIFWASLGLLLFFYRKSLGLISYLIMGLSFGAMFHHHYVSIFSTVSFLILISLQYFKKKQFRKVLFMLIGYALPFSLFILFDLKNPPGLFFGKYLLGGNTPQIETVYSIDLIKDHLYRDISIYLQTFVQNGFLQVILLFTSLILIIRELKTKTYQTLTWIVPATLIIFAGVIINDFQMRYVYPSIVFFFIWLLLPRKELLNIFLAKFIFLILILGSLLTIKNQLTISEVPPSMKITTNASQIIIDIINNEKLHNANVAALSSHDSDPLAADYRDYIRMRNTGLREPSEYDVSEHLFVISTATDEILRQDKSYAMTAFKDKKLRKVINVDSDWKVFWYGTE